MFASWFAESDLLAWPLVALAIFFVAFSVVLAREIRGLRRHERMDDVARLPLEADGREEA
jgi:hypothetical protein